MLKRQYLGYMILGLGLILLIIVLFSQTESTNSQSNVHSKQWSKSLALSVLCGEDCSPDFSPRFPAAPAVPPKMSFAGEVENQNCIQCHGDGITTDVDFLVSPQEMTHELQVRFLAVSKRIFALQPSQDSNQYLTLMDNYMQIHQRQTSLHPSSNPTEVGNALYLLTTVENLINEVEGQTHWANIQVVALNTLQEAVAPLRHDKKCGVGGICQQFIHSIKPPASSPEKHVSDTPIMSIEIKWSVSRRGPPAFSTLPINTTRRLQPFIYGRSSFVLGQIVIIPICSFSHYSGSTKEMPIERSAVKVVNALEIHVTASKHLEKSLR